MNYEAIDREMSSWLISCVTNGTRFYLTDEDVGTDLPGRATRHRWLDDAQAHAADQRKQRAWKGFDWQPISCAEVFGITR